MWILCYHIKKTTNIPSTILKISKDVQGEVQFHDPNMYKSPPLLQMLLLSNIHVAMVLQAQTRHPWMEDNAHLFNYLLESPKENQHIKPQRITIAWEVFAKRL
jgi:hypothetical protein